AHGWREHDLDRALRDAQRAARLPPHVEPVGLAIADELAWALAIPDVALIENPLRVAVSNDEWGHVGEVVQRVGGGEGESAGVRRVVIENRELGERVGMRGQVALDSADRAKARGRWI